MKGQRIGYLRVSSADQSTARQLDGLTLDRVFEDKVSGKDANRPALTELLQFVREGDTVVVHSLDRLARNLQDLLRLVKEMTSKGIKLHFIKENLIFTGEDSPMSNLLLAVLGAIAQFERSLIKERQREGIQVARRQGKYKGRKNALSPEQIQTLKERIAKGEKKALVAREFKISRETLYKYLKSKVA